MRTLPGYIALLLLGTVAFSYWVGYLHGRDDERQRRHQRRKTP